MRANGDLYRIIMYVVMGGFTTLINIFTFWLFATRFGIDYRIANTIAWIASVLFAYVTNKKYVFKSHTPSTRETIREIGSFVGFRFLSYLMDLGVMILLVSGFSMNETWAKVWTNVLVMVANYVFSKLFIFKNKSKSHVEGRNQEMDNQATHRNGVKIAVFSIGVFVFYLFLAYNAPLTHDDWTWATAAGWARLQNWFHDYNGRYLGNLLELLLTRNGFFRVVIMAAFSALLVLMTARMANRARLSYYLISFLAFLGVPISMFAQTYGWTAGFTNYLPSIVLTLVYLNIVKNIFENEQPKYKLWLTLFIIPLGVCSQLFVEHVTIYNLLAAVVVIIYAYIKFKRVYLLHILYFLSTITGAVMMFSNGAYAVIFHGNDSYRTVSVSAHHTSMIYKLLSVFVGKMYALLVMNNVLLNVLLAAFCIVALVMYQKQNKAMNTLKSILCFILVAYPLYKLIVVDSMGVKFFGYYSIVFEAFISVVFYLALLITVLISVQKRESKIKMILYLLSVIVLAAPFLVVTPIGPRCFLASYTFFVLFLIELAAYLTEEKMVNWKTLNKPILFATLALMLSYIYVFIMIGHASRERISEIHSQVESNRSVVTVAKLPFEQFLWHGTPILGTYQSETFKQYFRIPNNRPLRIVPYKHLNLSHK